MGKKMRRLICALLASAMVVSSVGMVAFADEETTNDITTEATEATEAPAEATEAPADATEAPAEATETPAEATEAPVEATEAPVTDEGAYSEDAYYQKALSLCTALGIISGYEDGSVRPESNVTRAEMSKIILTMLNITSMSKYQNNFTDVSESHWAADIIQTAQETGIINGMGDGTFAPDGNVTYAQIATMLVRAMNYTMDAEYNGGWPNGYMKVANTADLNLFKNAPGSNDVASDRGVVIKMVYNALLGMYKEITGYENNSPIYTANRTLAEAKFNLIEEKGVLLGTTKTSISSTELDENQVEIEYEVEDSDEKEAKVFDCSLTGLEEYLAQKITFYYKENAGLTPEVLAVTYDSSKTTTDTFDAEDIETVEGFDGDAGSIKVDGVSKAKNCTGATIVYNGKVLSDTDKTAIGADINDMLLPEVGTVKIVDSDKDDVYDVVFVDSYEVMVVSSAGEDRLTGKVSAATDNDTVGETKSVSLNLDDSIDRVVTVTKEGTEVKVRNLKKNDVATIKRSYDDSVVDIVVTGESVTGRVSGLSVKFNNSYATIDGTKYDIANIAAGDISTGTDGTYYFDMFGRIAYVEAAGTGMLQSGEEYGWIMDGYYSEDGSDYIVYMMTQEGTAVEMKVGSKLELWTSGSASSQSYETKADSIEAVKTMIDGNKFLMFNSGTTPIRLVKYKANSSDVISRMYCAVDSSAVDDEDALRINPRNLGGIGSASGLVGGYQIVDGLIEFSVPKNVEDMKDAENYKVGETASSQYVVRENGANFQFAIGEFTSSVAPSLTIKFTDSADAAAYVGDMDTAGNNPAMVVEEISMGVDDDDNPIYTINGYSNGAEVSVTTTKNTSIAKTTATTDMAIGDKYDEAGNKITGARMYVHQKLWDAVNGFDPKGGAETFSDVLSEGDIIIYETSGDRILKLYDAGEVYDYVVNGGPSVMVGAKNNYNTRNIFYFDYLVDSDLGDIAWLEQNGIDRISFDASKLMDTVEINVNTGSVTIDTEGSDISDLVQFDSETKTGDYVFARMCDKGALQEIMIYRFVD